ncbi:MAG: DUF4926 domain-containing protein [Planctomycetia bacterium]|nr:DUF4926 domain-containing protein [Planctomycetia bacterium]MDO5114214.1 DUF4926 domain-containing protein [Planctomycetia bacterium]
MKFSENEVVRVNVEKDTAKLGDIGTIICVFEKPNEAYEVEILNDNGTPKLQTVFLPDELEKYDV